MKRLRGNVAAAIVALFMGGGALLIHSQVTSIPQAQGGGDGSLPSGTGIVKVTSGTGGLATAGTDYAIPGGVCTVTATAGAITLDGACGNGTSSQAYSNIFVIGPLTGAITLPAPTNLNLGYFELQIVEGASNQTVTVPSWLQNAASLFTVQPSVTFIYRGAWNGSAVVNPTTGNSGVPYLTLQADPGINPAAGADFCWPDGSSLANVCRDASGNHYYQTKVAAGATATANNPVSYDSTNLFSHVLTSAADSTANATLVTGTFNESKSCTVSSAASIAFTGTVTIPANSITELGDHLSVLVDVLVTVPGANNADLQLDLLMDGANAWTGAAAPSNSILSETSTPETVTYEVWPTAIGSSNTSDTLQFSMTAGLNLTQISNQRFMNGTAALTAKDMTATHTIGAQFECTSATGTNTVVLKGIKVVRR